MLFEPEEVDTKTIQAGHIFHFGSITLIDEPARSATLHAVEAAREAGLLISYDPNLRLSLWPDAETARDGMLLGWPYAHIAKVSGEELAFLAQTEDADRAARKLWHNDLRLLVISDGARGCRYFTTTHSGQVPGFAVDTVDTTGAGDGFVAGLLKHLLRDETLFEDT
jgi:fructokinase